MSATVAIADMLQQLADIQSACFAPETRAFVGKLIEQAHAGNVTALSEDQIATLHHLYRMHCA